MNIRPAQIDDIKGIMDLLRQVLNIHHEGRPDIFKANSAKYTDEELYYIITNPLTPVFVAEDDGKNILGHCFCKFIQHSKDNVMTDIKTLYVDDLCVDENARGQHIGKALYEYAVSFAKKNGCYNLTLNVWAANESALRFYESMGLTIQKIGMEKIL